MSSLELFHGAIKTTAVASLVLLLKMLTVNLGAVFTRMKAGTILDDDKPLAPLITGRKIHNAKISPGLPLALNELQASEADKEANFRQERLIQNDLENIPVGMIIMWGSLICFGALTLTDDSVKKHSTAHIIFASLFACFRVTHSLSYGAWLVLFASVLNGLRMLKSQPPRSLSYIFAMLSVLGMAINAVVAAFEA